MTTNVAKRTGMNLVRFVRFVLLSVFTCGLYYIYWAVTKTEERNALLVSIYEGLNEQREEARRERRGRD